MYTSPACWRNQTPVTEADFRALKAGDYVREIKKFLEGME